ncbi:MAG: DUF1932 domain-containing protein [Sphingomonadaceae bacterium]
MSLQLALLGFGEAAQAFAGGAGWQARAFDVERAPARRARLREAAQGAGVALADDVAGALSGRPVVLSLVTAQSALEAARQAAAHLAPGALFLDMNSVAPDTKARAARAIEGAGARYADVAIMAPVHPAGRGVPLLVAGPAEAAAALGALGFTRVRHVGTAVGRAATIKLARSVWVKGLEALTAETLLAADRADVLDEVAASLGPGWLAEADARLERMLAHGTRRAAEMAEAARLLESLGLDPAITRGTVERQGSLGALALDPVPSGLAGRLAALREGRLR